MRDRERQRHRQRGKQVPTREPDVGLDPRTLGSRPELKAGAQPLSHPGITNKQNLKKRKKEGRKEGRKERKGKERKGKERKGKERKGKERKGKERNCLLYTSDAADD